MSDLLRENDFYTAMLANVTTSATDLPSLVESAAAALTDLVAQHATMAAEAVQGTKQKAIFVRCAGNELSTKVLHDAKQVERKETLKK